MPAIYDSKDANNPSLDVPRTSSVESQGQRLEQTTPLFSSEICSSEKNGESGAHDNLQEPSHLQSSLGFATYRELRQHQKDVHPPECKTCGNSFKKERTLQAHIREIHGATLEERKPFACSYEGCLSRFTKVRSNHYPQNLFLNE